MERGAAAFLVLLSAACTRPQAPQPPPAPEPATLRAAPAGWSPGPLMRRTFSEGAPEVRDADPEVSPDGRMLYFASNAHGPDFDIYRIPIGGTLVTRLIGRRGSNERMPRLDPANPSRIAFCSDAGGEWHIYVVDLAQEGANWLRITPDGTNNIGPSWAPGGGRIVYATQARRPGAAWELAIYEFDSRRTLLLGIEGLHPRWQPVAGSGRILFQQMRGRGDLLAGIWMVEIAGDTAGSPTRVFEQSGRAAINPNWSPDGVRIVFAMTGPRELQQGAEPTADDVYTIAADGTDLRPLTCDAPKDWSPLWARDGAIYFVSRRDGGENIWSMPAPAAGNP